MNRFIKECLTVASGLCAIGLVLVIIGGIFGGFRQTAAIALNGGFVYPIYLYDTMEESTDNESSSDFQEMSDGFYENDDVCDMSDV
ncbi:MAG TPA: hypothetical protein PLU43_12225, partial [Lachnospiraceae bacterium]|nr:hypothetical protein [Lachnospiraceae bacterium]